MFRRLLAGVLALSTHASCGTLSDSWINPFNWFGQDEEVQATPPTVVHVADRRPLVDQIVSVRMERVPGGAILHAVGLPPYQGYWGTALMEDAARSTPARRIFLFRIVPPRQAVRVSTPQSREVSAARFLSDQALEGVREVQVLGALNARAVGR